MIAEGPTKDLRSGMEFLERTAGRDTVTDAEMREMRSLRDHWTADEFFGGHPSVRQYPENMGARVDLDPGLGSKGAYSETYNTIAVAPADLPSIRSTALHELQHATQGREGFARGGSPVTAKMAIEDQRKAIYEELRELNKKTSKAALVLSKFSSRYGVPKPGNEVEFAAARAEYERLLERKRSIFEKLKEHSSGLNDPYEAYRRLAGETEARNVQKRRDYTADYRRMLAPWKTQDYPDEEQILLGL